MRILLTTSMILMLAGCVETSTTNSNNSHPPTNVETNNSSDNKNSVYADITVSNKENTEAARFLTQTTFGATTSSINELQAMESFESWIDAQIALSQSNPTLMHEKTIYLDADNNNARGKHMDRAWWATVLQAEDQLRHRMAFAWGQIFVTGYVQGFSKVGSSRLNYHDMLGEHAFGSFRELLEAVTLSPVMGRYLNMLNNKKADPEKGTHADENFAREIMQLFTIGLHELNIDGTYKLDAQGKRIPTYTQEDIENTARALTGWIQDEREHFPTWLQNEKRQSYFFPMIPDPDPAGKKNNHDFTAKTIIGGVQLPANQSIEKDLKDVLDTLASHPNVAPFISKQLIQRLVTSNPTPEYVARVATVFNNTNGDLTAVTKTILLDDEARKGHKAMPETFGKVKEPIIRLAAFWRAFEAYSDPNLSQPLEHFHHSGTFLETAQGVVSSPTVFNFYRPDYAPSGTFVQNNRVSPELQIALEDKLVRRNNSFFKYSYSDTYNFVKDENWAQPTDHKIRIKTKILKDFLEQGQKEAAIEHLNLLLMSGSMPEDMKQLLRDYLNNELASKPAYEATHLLLYLVASSSQQAIQR